MLSDELLLERAGNFTASENHRLMAGWDIDPPDVDFEEFDSIHSAILPLFNGGCRKFLVGDVADLIGYKPTGKMISDTLSYIKYNKPSQGLITYAEEKAIETLFNVDPSLNFSTVHTVNGEEREQECMRLLSNHTGLDFKCTGDNQIHIHHSEIGCTPDGVLYDDMDLVTSGAEVKCKSPLVHAKSLLINNSDDLKEAEFNHYVQIQTAMLVTGADHWHFANYNPFAIKTSMQFKAIIIKRNDDFIKVLANRIEEAKKIKKQFLEVIN